MKPILRDYIYFTRSQRKALLIISIFIGFLIAFNQTAHLFLNQEIDLEVDYLEAKYQALSEKEDESASTNLDREGDQEFKSKLFPFNPNQISKADWQELGLSEAQANSILKYREKGGSFKVKSDLKKMYVVSDERYRSWEDFISLPDEITAENKEANQTKTFKEYKAVVIDLNRADSASFTQLRGIGPVYASRIVKYRKALGGFYSIDQLAEVWGLDDSILIRLHPQLKLSETKLIKLKINHLEAADLKSHPYLSWQEANAIVNYRKQHGAYERIEDLQKIYSLSDKVIQRISPYLVFD